MKTLSNTVLALAATLMMAGSASALTESGVNSMNIQVDATETVSILHGSLQEKIESGLVEIEISRLDGVETIKSYLTASN